MDHRDAHLLGAVNVTRNARWKTPKIFCWPYTAMGRMLSRLRRACATVVAAHFKCGSTGLCPEPERPRWCSANLLSLDCTGLPGVARTGLERVRGLLPAELDRLGPTGEVFAQALRRRQGSCRSAPTRLDRRERPQSGDRRCHEHRRRCHEAERRFGVAPLPPGPRRVPGRVGCRTRLRALETLRRTVLAVPANPCISVSTR
jgi:hypothetical protein